MPPPIAGTSFSSLGSSTTMASVVVIREETLYSKRRHDALVLRNIEVIEQNIDESRIVLAYLAASTSAVLITFRGSMMPALTMSTYSPGHSCKKNCTELARNGKHWLFYFSYMQLTFSCIVAKIRVVLLQQFTDHNSSLNSRI